MRNYFFVAPSLPALVLGRVPEMSFKELMVRLQLNLSKGDLQQVEVIRRVIDLQNIRALYAHESLNSFGNLSEKELDEALLVEADLPEYVFEFLRQFEGEKEKVRNFSGLLSRYYTEEVKHTSGFLKDLLILQREMRLVLLALRAKKTGRDVVHELQFEEFTDPMVAHILAQKDQEDYDPPHEYVDLKRKIEECGGDTFEQYRAVCVYEFEKIEEMTGYPLFTLDWILGYLARLLLVERMHALDEKRGEEVMQRYKTGK